MANLFESCLHTAKKSPQKTQYCAVIIYKKRIIGIGYNYDTRLSSSNEQYILCS